MPKSKQGRGQSTPLDWYLAAIDDAFEKRSWHGPNLKGSLRGVTREQALWRPNRGRKNIWEIMLHAAYWKYTVGRRLLREKRGSFPLEGSNWFPRDAESPDQQWREEKRLLDSIHRSTRHAVENLRDADLSKPIDDGKLTYDELLRGIAFHDVYHAGQIQTLKKCQTTSE